MVNIKACTKCKIPKELKEFGKDKTNTTGYNSQCKLCKKKYYNLNKNKYKQRTLKWKENNLEEWRKQDSIRQKKRRKMYPHFRKWAVLLENTLKRLNKQKQNSTLNSLKYSALELKEHLDKLGMNWETDHIDHKIPITWFEKETPPYIVNDLRNLQPLNSKLNKIKSNKFSDSVDKDYYNLIIQYIKIEYQSKISALSSVG